MSIIKFTFPARSRDSQEQKWQRILTPLLNELIATDESKQISINNNNELCINGVSLGNADLISNFRIEDGVLMFDYGGNTRLLSFKLNEQFDSKFSGTIFSITEYSPRTRSCEQIYHYE